MRKLLFIILLLFLSNISFSGYKSDWNAVSSGGGTSSSGGSFKNSVALVGGFAGKSTEDTEHSRLYSGFAPAFVEIEDVQIIFFNPYPSEDKVNETSEVLCKITIQSYTNDIDTNTVKFRISNSGTSGFANDWTSGGVEVDEWFNSKKIRYSVSIPTSAAGKKFSPGSDNYIQWRCYDKASNSEISSPFNIKVLQPSIEIIQPVDFSSMYPVFEVRITGAVDYSTILLDVDTDSGADVIQYSGAQGYDSSTGLYKKAVTSKIFSAGKKYSLTASVEDSNGSAYTDTSEFTVNDEAIADLVPFPSPFDPSAEGVTIRYVLEKDSKVSISIYNTAGELVKTLVDNENRSAGLNTSDIWYGKNFKENKMANGIYFCEIIAEDSEGEHRKYIALAVLSQ